MSYVYEPISPFTYEKHISFNTDVTVTKNYDEYICVFSYNGIVEIPNLHLSESNSSDWFIWCSLDGPVEVEPRSFPPNYFFILGPKNIEIQLDFHQFHNTDSAYQITFSSRQRLKD